MLGFATLGKFALGQVGPASVIVPGVAADGCGPRLHRNLKEVDAPTDPWSTGGGTGSVGASPRGQGHIMLLLI